MKEPMEIKTGTDTERNYPRNRIGLHYLPECSAIFLWAIGATPWATRRDSWFGGMAPRFKIFGRLGEIKHGFAPPPSKKKIRVGGGPTSAPADTGVWGGRGLGVGIFSTCEQSFECFKIFKVSKYSTYLWDCL